MDVLKLTRLYECDECGTRARQELTFATLNRSGFQLCTPCLRELLMRIGRKQYADGTQQLISGELQSEESPLAVAVGLDNQALIKQLQEENEALRKGAPLGPIVGAATIVQQAQELRHLQVILGQAAKLLPLPSVLSEAVDGALTVANEGVTEDNSEDEVVEANEVVAWYRATRDVNYQARVLRDLKEENERLRQAVADVVSHQEAWERALARQREQAMKKGDSGLASYWNHEIGVLQRTAESLRDYPQ